MQLSDFRNEPFTDFSQPENKQAFEAALKKVQKDVLGRTWPCWIGGEEVRGKKTFEGYDPGELSRLIGKYQELGKSEADVAVEKAYAAFPEWSRTDVQYRVDLFMKAAQLLRERKHEFSAMLCYEVGK
ncbi:MAG: aldehyde dehydrogenase family protein, partial [Planctomycetes bacterium]|nr:aldehyde dehydrogenase family protein [Planctomycetota bacterium]